MDELFSGWSLGALEWRSGRDRRRAWRCLAPEGGSAAIMGVWRWWFDANGVRRRRASVGVAGMFALPASHLVVGALLLPGMVECAARQVFEAARAGGLLQRGGKGRRASVHVIPSVRACRVASRVGRSGGGRASRSWRLFGKFALLPSSFLPPAASGMGRVRRCRVGGGGIPPSVVNRLPRKGSCDMRVGGDSRACAPCCWSNPSLGEPLWWQWTDTLVPCALAVSLLTTLASLMTSWRLTVRVTSMPRPFKAGDLLRLSQPASVRLGAWAK